MDRRAERMDSNYLFMFCKEKNKATRRRASGQEQRHFHWRRTHMCFIRNICRMELKYNSFLTVKLLSAIVHALNILYTFQNANVCMVRT